MTVGKVGCGPESISMTLERKQDPIFFVVVVDKRADVMRFPEPGTGKENRGCNAAHALFLLAKLPSSHPLRTGRYAQFANFPGCCRASSHRCALKNDTQSALLRDRRSISCWLRLKYCRYQGRIAIGHPLRLYQCTENRWRQTARKHSTKHKKPTAKLTSAS